MPVAAAVIIGGASIAAGAMASSAAGKAAKTQAAAADQAAQAQLQSTRESLALQREQYNTTRSDFEPWRMSGYGALNQLNGELGLPAYTPTAYTPPASQPGSGVVQMPTGGTVGQPAVRPNGGGGISNEIATVIHMGQQRDAEAAAQQPQPDPSASAAPPATAGYPAPGPFKSGFQETPGYQFAFNQGVQALDRSAASRGRLLSGAQDKALTRYGIGTGNQEYGNYLNRLSSMAGVGQTATGSVASAGQNFAQGGSNALMAGGNAVANGLNNAAGARASGYINSANAWGSAINSGASLAAFGYGNGWFGGGGGAAPAMSPSPYQSFRA